MDNKTSYEGDGFHSCTLASIASVPDRRKELVEWYMHVFNTTGDREWAESWTPESAEERLFGQQDEIFADTVVTMWRVDGQMMGATIACTQPIDRSIRLHDLPPALMEQCHLDAVIDRLKWVAGDDVTVQFVREMGILKEARAGIRPVLELLSRPLRIGQAQGASFVFCWTNEGSRIYDIIVGLDLRVIHSFGDEDKHMVVGDEISHIIRRFMKSDEEIIARLRAYQMQKP